MSNEPQQPTAIPTGHELLTASNASCELDTRGHCFTCSDEAQRARVLRVDAVEGIAFVMVKDAMEEEIDITLVENVDPGDVLLVQGGVALAHVAKHSPNEAGEASDE